MSQRTESKGRALALNLLLLVGTCVVLFLVGELGLRAYQQMARGIPFFSFLPDFRPQTHFQVSPFLVFGPRINYQLPGKRLPQHAYFNRQGFRAPDEIGPKQPGEFRIITLGGSTTEDANTVDGLHWPLRLEHALHAAGRTDVRVLNGAMAAYSSAHTLVRFAFDILPYDPDMVIVMDNVNDLTVNYYARRFGKPLDPNYLVKYGIKSYTENIDDRDVVLSRLWHSIWVRIDQRLHPHPAAAIPDDYDLGPGLRAFERNLRSTVAVAKAHETEIVLLTMPVSRLRETYDSTRSQARGADPGYFPSYDRFMADFDAYNEGIKTIGRATGVPVIDMHASMTGHDAEYFVDIVHYSDAGSSEFARALAAHLLPLLPGRDTAARSR